jgi:hypothetical protein
MNNMAESHPKGYPSNFDQFRDHEVYGHGGVRIYRISPQQAAAIHKELKMPYDLQELREGHEYFYLNQNHGEHHVIFVFPKIASH